MKTAAPIILLITALIAGCSSTDTAPDATDPSLPQPASPVTAAGELTRQIDMWDVELARLAQTQPDEQFNEALLEQARLGFYAQRWEVIQLAASHHGTLHRDAFYGSRAFWHTRSSRGLAFALDEKADLNDPFYIDSRANVRVMGDVNADIEVAGSAVVHILGDLNAKLILKGVSEVIVGGRMTENAAITCDGQLELYCGGDSAASISATRSAKYIIDGDAKGEIRCSAPATMLTVTGDLAAELPAPQGEDAVLTLRVDGFAPTQMLLDLEFAGYTRVNATIGYSSIPPGLYPQDTTAARPVARWVVLRQREAAE